MNAEADCPSFLTFFFFFLTAVHLQHKNDQYREIHEFNLDYILMEEITVARRNFFYKVLETIDSPTTNLIAKTTINLYSHNIFIVRVEN